MKARPWYTTLTVQVLLFLSLALLPLAFVAIFQSYLAAQESERNTELALLALTERAARQEQLLIERAFGAARFLSSLVPGFINAPERCESELSAFTRSDEQFQFVGILPASGVMTCSSDGRQYDLSDMTFVQRNLRSREPSIAVNANAPFGNTAAFVITDPFEISGNFAGLVTIAIPHSGVTPNEEALAQQGLVELVTFNIDGTVLAGRRELDEALPELPVRTDLQKLAATGSQVFHGENTRGESRVYTVVPIVGSPARVLGVWNPPTLSGPGALAFLRAAILPALMWLVSIAVAVLSIHALVLRHLSRLRRNMDQFARSRNVDELEAFDQMPAELQALSQNFIEMTQSILHEEANLEDALREKNVLIKEIHHRVKNNLQLISSIMNMQIRNAEHQETKTVLSRVQDRVLSLATIHRDLYSSDTGGSVDVGRLVSEVLSHSIALGVDDPKAIDTDIEIASVLLYPDQAVPLLLLVAEGATNAMKYIDAPDDGRPWFYVSLEQEGDICRLTLKNSILGEKQISPPGTGMGAQLIRAFAIQLGGKVRTTRHEDHYEMLVEFRIAEFVPEQRDF